MSISLRRPPPVVRVDPLGRTEPEPEPSRLDGLLLSSSLWGGVVFQGFGMWGGGSCGEAEVPQRSEVSGSCVGTERTGASGGGRFPQENRGLRGGHGYGSGGGACLTALEGLDPRVFTESSEGPSGGGAGSRIIPEITRTAPQARWPQYCHVNTIAVATPPPPSLSLLRETTA